MNGGLYPMSNGLTPPGDALPRRARLGRRRRSPTTGPSTRARRVEAGLVFDAPDDIDWDDEVRMAIEARTAFSPDALTGMEANLRFAGPETMETKIFGRLTAWQNWIFQRPNAVGERGALMTYGREGRPAPSTGGADVSHDLERAHPEQRRPRRQQAAAARAGALAARLSRLVARHGAARVPGQPPGLPAHRHQRRRRRLGALRLRQAAGIPLGHLPGRADATTAASASATSRASRCGRKCPGEFRNQLRRLIVIQGDTEPASVEQQRSLGAHCPSLYDLRNLFQVNVEEGRHLWAMVYLLHSYFGRDGREEAEALLERRSGNDDTPRMLEAFNEPIDTWLDFFAFTMFTDRDGKSQLLSLSESSLDPLARTTRFMLTEEAHHMFVGESGMARILERTCQLLRESGFSGDVRKAGGIDLPLIQKFVNFWFSQSLDLHGSEVSSNAAAYFSNGLKGRAEEDKFDDDHILAGNMYVLDMMDDSGLIIREEVPMRNALNEVLRDWYVGDCQAGVDRWNKRVLEAHGMSERIALPSRKFNRKVGVYAGRHFDPWGNSADGRGVGAPQVRVAARRPDDKAYLHSIQATPVYKPGPVRQLHRAAAARHQPSCRSISSTCGRRHSGITAIG